MICISGDFSARPGRLSLGCIKYRISMLLYEVRLIIRQYDFEVRYRGQIGNATQLELDVKPCE